MTTSLITEAQEALRIIGGDWPRGEKQPDYVERLARATSLTKSAVERILYGKRKRLFADEYLTLKAKLNALQEQRARLETSHAAIADRLARSREAADRDAQSPGGGGATPVGSGAVPAATGEASASRLATTGLAGEADWSLNAAND